MPNTLCPWWALDHPPGCCCVNGVFPTFPAQEEVPTNLTEERANAEQYRKHLAGECCAGLELRQTQPTRRDAAAAAEFAYIMWEELGKQRGFNGLSYANRVELIAAALRGWMVRT